MMEQQAEEAQWVARTLAGDRTAFHRLVERYTGAVYNHAYRMLNNRHDAEDAVQEIFLRAYTRLESFDPQRRFVTWVLTITSNYCIDRLRRRRNAWLTLDDVAFWLPSPRPGPERSVLDQERRELVQQALHNLPETYRQVAILRYWQDLSYAEIAEVSGLTEAAVKTRLHRARKLLAEMLEQDGEGTWSIAQTS